MFMVLLLVVLVFIIVWILLIKRMVLFIFLSLVMMVLMCFLKFFWYWVFVKSVFILSENMVELIRIFGIFFLIMCCVNFFVMVVLLMFGLFISNGLFFEWWYKIWIMCLILEFLLINGLIFFVLVLVLRLM